MVLRDKRSLIYVPWGREDTPYVTDSIKDIREHLTTTLKELGPDAAASSHLEILRRACRRTSTRRKATGALVRMRSISDLPWRS